MNFFHFTEYNKRDLLFLLSNELELLKKKKTYATVQQSRAPSAPSSGSKDTTAS